MNKIPEDIQLQFDILCFKNYLAWQNDIKIPVEENRKEFLEILERF